MEPRKVSIAKSVSWRVLGVALLFVITYVITQSLISTTLVVITHHVAFIFIFYFHERWWQNKIWWTERDWVVKYQRFIKAFTYEIILGFMVLGLITFIFTGSWKAVTSISVTYLGLRFVGFPVHDWFWGWFYERCHGRR